MARVKRLRPIWTLRDLWLTVIRPAYPRPRSLEHNRYEFRTSHREQAVMLADTWEYRSPTTTGGKWPDEEWASDVIVQHIPPGPAEAAWLLGWRGDTWP